MAGGSQTFTLDDVEWQDDLALFRSMDGRVPWAERFGQGRVKVLSFDLNTQSGSYVFDWPPGYDPLGEHGHGGNCSELVLAGALVQGDDIWGPGSFLQVSAGHRHGPFKAGPEGCTFLVQVEGPLFAEAFLEEMMEEGKAARRRV